ncbi:MAG: zinc-dependent alcohol dehydrogenase family protein [Flectobacillus sp.]|uniref:zinc-dependent alcohol dehydrogenase family protein n=1 Tax=Flectobacillus sp. TaxID=50419 RepID=UPI003B9A013D
MKALIFNQKGATDQILEYSEVVLNNRSSNEVTVKLLASPINPADFMFIEKSYRIEPVFPQIAGFEGAGLIIDNGGDENYPIDALVAFRHKNVWAEFVNVPKDKIIMLPQHMPIEKAAQLSLNPITAWALLELSEAKKGEWIILSAANSALCKLIIQFAKSRSIKTLAIIRNEHEANAVLELGATEFIIDKTNNFENKMTALTNGETIAAFLDAVGGELATKVINVISKNGRIIHYGLFSEDLVSYHNSSIIFRNLHIMGFGIDAWLESKTKEELQIIWDSIIDALNNSDFKMEVISKHSLEDYKNAITNSKSGKSGKVLFWLN